jgi:hypothetical protein
MTKLKRKRKNIRKTYLKSEIEKKNKEEDLVGGNTVLSTFTEVKTVLNPYVISHETKVLSTIGLKSMEIVKNFTQNPTSGGVYKFVKAQDIIGFIQPNSFCIVVNIKFKSKNQYESEIYGICIEYSIFLTVVPIFTFLFLETTLVPQFLKWSLNIFCTYTNSDRLFSFLIFVKCCIIRSETEKTRLVTRPVGDSLQH